jgi:hypothetical protein
MKSPIEHFLKRFSSEARANAADKEVMLVNLTTLPATKQDMVKAFAVSENILWWRALMQTLEIRRQEQVDAGAAAVRANNPLLASGCVYAADIIGDVIKDLTTLRQKSVTE